MTILDLTPTTRSDIFPSASRISLAYRREVAEKPPKPEAPHKAAMKRIASGIGSRDDLEIVRAFYIAEKTQQFQEALARGLIRTGKTRRHAAGQYQMRRRERRVAHEGWMQKVSNNPNQAHAHPFSS